MSSIRVHRGAQVGWQVRNTDFARRMTTLRVGAEGEVLVVGVQLRHGMDDDAGDPSAPFGVADGRDRDVDRPALPGEQSVLFGRGVVAERGALSRAQERRPQLRLAVWFAGVGGVDAALQSLPLPVPDLVSEAFLADVQLPRLKTRGPYKGTEFFVTYSSTSDSSAGM